MPRRSSHTDTNANPNTSTPGDDFALCSLQTRSRNEAYSCSRNAATTTTTTSTTPTPSAAAHPLNATYTNPGAVQATSVVNLSNSNDVVIGAMTLYQGPVTIYQYMDATVEARSMQASGGINQSQNTKVTTNTQKIAATTLSKLLLLVLIIAIVLTGIGVYIKVRNNREKEKHRLILFGNNYEGGSFPNLGNGHFIIDRAQWGASVESPPLTIQLPHPIPYALVTHMGVQSEPCDTIYECSYRMRIMLDAAVAEKRLPDINSNFYVADDGNIYVGRGWDFANTYANNTLAITFLGDYGRYVPGEKQLEATQYLLAHAVKHSYLDVDYKLVAHNQTKNTKSPGVNVYREIKTWPHFYPCGMDGNPRCGSELGMPAVWDGKI